MGRTISASVYNSSVKLLVIGPTGSGKSILVQHIKHYTNQISALMHNSSTRSSSIPPAFRKNSGTRVVPEELVTDTSSKLSEYVGFSPKETRATTGQEVDTIHITDGDVSFDATLRELGGAMSQLWSEYFDRTDAIIFTISLANPAELADAAVEFTKLCYDSRLSKVPVFLLMNKCDAPYRMSSAMVCDLMHLANIHRGPRKSNPVVCAEISALVGTNLGSLYEWLCQLGSTSSVHS